MEKEEWYITEFTGNGYDCCDCKVQPIRIDNNMAEKYGLGKKHFKLPCPSCGKVGTWKRHSWSVGHETDTYNGDQEGGPVLVCGLPDMTKAALEMEIKELADRIVANQRWISNAREEIREITHLVVKM